MTAGPAVATAPPAQPTRRPSRGWWLAALVVLVPTLIPPISLAWQVVTGGIGLLLPADRLLELFGNTLLLTIAVTLTAIVIGTATAWLTNRKAIPGRRIWLILAAVPLVVPSYMAALTIVGATGPGGLLSSWLGFDIPTPYGFVGAWAALSLFLAPMAHLIVSPALRLIDPATEEAATGLGASPRRVFSTITLPQLRPALVSAGLMIGLYTVSDFGAVSLLRFDTLTRAIYTLYAGQLDRRPAAALSLVLMLVALAILFAERRTRSRAEYQTGSMKRRRALAVMRPGRRLGAIAFLATYIGLTLAIPLAVLLYWLFRGVEAGADTGSFGIETLRTVGVSAAAAAMAAIASLPLAMVTTWRRNRSSTYVESSVWAVYALPHITMGVAVVTFALVWARPLYQSLPLLVFAYASMFLAQSVSTTEDSLRRSSPVLEDASRGLGQGPLATIWRVTIPVARPGLLTGAALVGLSVMKELPATLLLRPNGFETLAVRIWSSTGEGFYTTASVASLALLVVSIVPLLALTYRDLRD